ncbi:MAG: HAD hydrolase-like protein [Desulfotalea sp.]
MNILFDLDGTLTDSSEGITNSIKFALQELGYKIPEHDVLMSCIGPPLITSLTTMLEVTNQVDADKCVQLYRERYISKGYLENKLYPGILSCLRELNDLGHQLFVATAKPHPQVQPILDHFQITKYFTAFHGVHPDSTHSDKSGLISNIIQEHKLDKDNTAMIGDRKYDISGAVNNDILAIGAGYGYGSNEELQLAGANYIVNSESEILGLVKNLQL